jgi:tRNA G18 (ribose-2'-O)-methylase SpoU
MKKLSLDELNRLSVEAFKQAEKFPLVVVLDNLRSLNNVGSFFRTADAFRIQKLYLCGYTPAPPHREITRSALGAELSVAWEKKEDTLLVIKDLQAQGYEVWAVEQAQESQLLHQFQVGKNKSYALVFGNEVEGVADDVMQQVNGAIEIPQFGTKHSFNVAISAGIVLWEFISKNLTEK